MDKSPIQLTKEQILEAAEETLRKFGVARTSVTDIAKALKVSQGTLYRYYKNKNELLEAATEEWLQEKIIKPLSEISAKNSEEGFKHLRLYLQTLMELKQHYARKDGELFSMYAKVTMESSALIEQHIGQIIGHMTSIIAAGKMKIEDPERLARSLFYATSRFHHPGHAYEWDNPAIYEEFHDIMNLFESGIHNNH
ncbi:TetR/AcrR family transcriptional regulator [Paenibacillus pinihumi]|uniref:TetR/AcrR family transcriptional regulator n=1 Tax=Paenibacillus pinihumi TaxID=669462 RepID=UPI00040DA708|nr:TetR family transcriptional regulator [Paenibacillus pinihumi]